jgi:hypothetical protein
MDYSQFLPALAAGLAARSELLKEIYTDLAKPGVSQVGLAIGTILGLGNTALWRIQLLNESKKITIQNNLEKYREQLKDIPEADVTPVPPEVGVPILEKLAYVADDELSELYINLLSKASTIQTVQFAHPSFVNIINNLSPDEAFLLKEISRFAAIPFVTFRLYKKDKSGEYVILRDLATGFEHKVPLSFKQNIRAYFSNFQGLGLISIEYGKRLAEPSIYEELRAIYLPEKDQSWDEELFSLRFQHGQIEITDFGKLFLEACLKKLKSEPKPE